MKQALRIGSKVVANFEAMRKLPNAPVVATNDWKECARQLIESGRAEPYEGLACLNGDAYYVRNGWVFKVDRDTIAYFFARMGENGPCDDEAGDGPGDATMGWLDRACADAQGRAVGIDEPLTADPFGKSVCEAVLEEQARFFQRKARGRFWDNLDDIAMLYDYVFG